MQVPPPRAAVASLFNEIRAARAAHADPARVAKYARYFKEGYDAYGVDFRDAGWRGKQKSWLEASRKLGIAGFLALGDLLVRTGKYEEASPAGASPRTSSNAGRFPS